MKNVVTGFKVAKGFENRDVIIPKRATSSSAGYDIHLIDDITIKAGEYVMIDTGLKVSMRDVEYLAIVIRSSVALKHNVILTNGVGIIDADYFENPDNDGHFKLALHNIGKEDKSFKKGDRIAQGIFHQYFTVDNDYSSGKREGGFGSTSK